MMRRLIQCPIMDSLMNHFLIFSLCVLFNPKSTRLLVLSSSETRLFELHSLPHDNLTFLGDSCLQSSQIVLTKELKGTHAPRSAGVVLYSHPLLFLDPHSKKVPSFNTKFAFTNGNLDGDEEASGDGLAFLISPDDDLLGSPGYLGLVDSTNSTRNKFIAVEFDTRYDPMFKDPDDNHVGLDINSLFSVKLATSSSLSMSLKSGIQIRAWIDYRSSEKRLEVFLSDSYLKPNTPLLKVDIDLSDYLKDNMFVGFSAATERSMQFTRIEQWEFTVMGLNPTPPPPPLERTFPNPSISGHRHTHLSRYAIAFIVGLCSVPFIVLFGWFCWKRLMGMILKQEGTNNVEMQTIKSSVGISCQNILLFILVNRVVRSLNTNKVLDNEIELVHMKASSIPVCNSLPAVKSSILPHCNGLLPRTNDCSSVR